MKGIIFVEFFNMVENSFSPQVLENIISRANLPHGGSYTSVGYYPHEEMVTLVKELSSETGITVSDLLKSFGEYLFSRFTTIYPHFINNCNTAFELLNSVDQYIHVEVLKIYPNAELPSIKTETIDDKNLLLTYQSKRNLQDLAYGLIVGCIKHYKANISIKQENINNQDGQLTKFLLTKLA